MAQPGMAPAFTPFFVTPNWIRGPACAVAEWTPDQIGADAMGANHRSPAKAGVQTAWRNPACPPPAFTPFFVTPDLIRGPACTVAERPPDQIGACAMRASHRSPAKAGARMARHNPASLPAFAREQQPTLPEPHKRRSSPE